MCVLHNVFFVFIYCTYCCDHTHIIFISCIIYYLTVLFVRNKYNYYYYIPRISVASIKMASIKVKLINLPGLLVL